MAFGLLPGSTCLREAVFEIAPSFSAHFSTIVRPQVLLRFAPIAKANTKVCHSRVSTIDPKFRPSGSYFGRSSALVAVQ
jgi:hypothetical protein